MFMTTLADNFVDIKDLFIYNDDIPDRKLSYIRKMFENCLCLFVKISNKISIYCENNKEYNSIQTFLYGLKIIVKKCCYKMYFLFSLEIKLATSVRSCRAPLLSFLIMVLL